MLWLFNVMVTPNHEITSLLLHKCNFVILLLLWITCYAGYVTCDPCGVAAHMLRTADLGKSSFYGDKILSLRKSAIWPSNMSQMSDSGDGCQVKLFWQMLPYLKEKLTGYLTKHSWVSTKSKCLFDQLLPSSSIKFATLFLTSCVRTLKTILSVYTILGNFLLL